MVPPGYGAAYWRRGSWRHGVAGRMRVGLYGACNCRCGSWWRGFGPARFRGLCGPGRGGMSKNSLLVWMTRAGRSGERYLGNGAWKNGVWGNGVGVLGVAWLAPGKRWMQGQACLVAASGERDLEERVGGTAPGCGVWERKAGAEAGYPSKDAGKLKRDGAARKQGAGAAKGDAGEMLQEGKLRS